MGSRRVEGISLGHLLNTLRAMHTRAHLSPEHISLALYLGSGQMALNRHDKCCASSNPRSPTSCIQWWETTAQICTFHCLTRSLARLAFFSAEATSVELLQCWLLSVVGEIDIVDVGKRKRLRNAALTSEAQKWPHPRAQGPTETVVRGRRRARLRFVIALARLFLQMSVGSDHRQGSA